MTAVLNPLGQHGPWCERCGERGAPTPAAYVYEDEFYCIPCLRAEGVELEAAITIEMWRRANQRGNAPLIEGGGAGDASGLGPAVHSDVSPSEATMSEKLCKCGCGTKLGSNNRSGYRVGHKPKSGTARAERARSAPPVKDNGFALAGGTVSFEIPVLALDRIFAGFTDEEKARAVAVVIANPGPAV
jgi:hypothetical protein